MTVILAHSQWHTGVAAEAFTAALFARAGYDISVQYGANQPEYDLLVVRGEAMLKVSVKGSKDGGWGLTQSHKSKEVSYHQAVDAWLMRHKPRTIFALVQFEGVGLLETPRVYLATPAEIAAQLKKSAGGRGETILWENHTWGPRAAVGRCPFGDKPRAR
ncbi:MAG: hypothetical protein AB1918_14980 [Pseudomonadota bacterium]